jgi:hypothetical protein
LNYSEDHAKCNNPIADVLLLIVPQSRSNSDLTVPAIANQERVSTGYLSRLLRLPALAPDIITAIINGKHPPQLTAKKLMRLALQIPVDWTEQRELLGFAKE